MQRDDYIERLIAQITAAIARVLGLAKSGHLVEADREMAASWSNAVGLRRSDVDRLDDATLRALLGDRRIAAATLLEAEGELRRMHGDLESASRLDALAAALRR